MSIEEARKKIREAAKVNLNHLNLNAENLTNEQFSELFPEIRLDNLKSISLVKNQLTEIPKEILQIKHLIMLYFTNNQITEIPKEISHLKYLELLSIQDNELIKVSKEIYQASNLKKLYLSNNPLKELPNEISQLRLKEFTIDKNQLRDFAKTIIQLGEVDLQIWNGKSHDLIPREISIRFKNPQELLNYYFRIPEGEKKEELKESTNYNSKLKALLNVKSKLESTKTGIDATIDVILTVVNWSVFMALLTGFTYFLYWLYRNWEEYQHLNPEFYQILTLIIIPIVGFVFYLGKIR